MVIQVILAEVREDSDSESRAVDPVQIQCMRADLHRHSVDLSIAHAAQQPLQIGGLWCGARAGKSADQFASAPGGPPDGGDHMSGRRLSVRPGHADYLERLGGMAVKGRCERAHRRPGVGDHELRDRRSRPLRPIDE